MAKKYKSAKDGLRGTITDDTICDLILSKQTELRKGGNIGKRSIGHAITVLLKEFIQLKRKPNAKN